MDDSGRPVMPAFHVALNDALNASPSVGNLATAVVTVESVHLEFYNPAAEDGQRPHEEHEYYLIARGTAILTVDQQMFHCAVGDAVFVPALAPHRFTELSDDFATWVVLFGAPQQGQTSGER